MAELRFYAELNHFLAPALRGRSFSHPMAPHESIKHAIESLGVPHTEVGLVLLEGAAVGLEHRPVREGERLAVFPAFQRLQPVPGLPGRAPPPHPLRFVADAHLGRLARYLRFAGYDTLYHKHGADAELVAMAQREGRVVLSRDRDLLMHREVEHGCYLYETEPLAQLRELGHRLALQLAAAPASRCLLCNAVLEAVPKAAVADRLLPGTRQHFEAFWRCPCCGRIFWQGSHWERMHREVLRAIGPEVGHRS